MKLTTIALATAFALSGTFAYAQTNSAGSSAAGGPAASKNDTSDPLIRKPTSGKKAMKNGSTGVTTGNSMRNINGRAGAGATAPVTGAPLSSQKSGTNTE